MTPPPTPIAFCITDLDPGGAERALVQLVTRLDRARWLPAVFALAAPGALVEPLQAAGIEVVCFGARGVRHARVVFRLARALRRFRPAVLQTFLFHANFAGRIAGRLAGVPHIVSGIRVAERRTRTHLCFDRLSNWMVDRNVCVSEAVAEFSVQVGRLRPEKNVVIPNGVDAALYADACAADLTPFGIPSGSCTLIGVGRLDPQKGWKYLLDAMGSPALRSRDVHLLLVGEGPERAAIESIIREQQLTARVHLAGWRADVPQLLRAASCLVLPSLWEGMPNVVLEAMAARLPVIATRVEGVSELVAEGQTGLLVAPRSAAELEAAVLTVLEDPQQARELGAAGQERAKSEFSWEKMALRYEQLYASLLQNER
jgi:glycosyltransferase involved in cell wall biosynthesis